MLRKIDLKELRMKNKNLEFSACNLKRIQAFDHMEKFNCKEVLTTNNILQVLAGIVCNNGLETEMPITMHFKAGIDLVELINMPTVRLFPSIFTNIRALTYENKFIGIWAKVLSKEARAAYEELYNKDNLDRSLKEIFKFNKDIIIENHKMPAAYEIITEEEPKVVYNFINNKLIMYLLTECTKHKDVLGVPLKGFTLKEIEKNHYFLELKKFFQKVFLVGTGEDEKWHSTHIILEQPKGFE